MAHGNLGSMELPRAIAFHGSGQVSELEGALPMWATPIEHSPA